MRSRFLLTLFHAALLGCSKSDSNPIMVSGMALPAAITRIIRLAPATPTNWASDGEWNKKERALFADLGFDLNGPQQPAAINRISVYHNPAQGSFAKLTIETQRLASGAAGYTFSAVLVDRNYRALPRLGPNGGVSGFTYAFDYRGWSLSPNELYRFYYVAYSASGLIYKGHGDMRYSMK